MASVLSHGMQNIGKDLPHIGTMKWGLALLMRDLAIWYDQASALAVPSWISHDTTTTKLDRDELGAPVSGVSRLRKQ